MIKRDLGDGAMNTKQRRIAMGLVGLILVFGILAGVVTRASQEGSQQVPEAGPDSPGSEAASETHRCLLVTSYHEGYAWQDGLVNGVRSVLEGKCELKQFDMDTKRNKEEHFARQKALEAKALIESYKPDVVIVTDDNTSRYLVQPYFKDADIPFVFCGVNWTVEEYGYPYSNATGMIEVAPIEPLLKEIQSAISAPKKSVYLSGDVETDHTNFEWYKRTYEAQGVEVSAVFVETMAEWEAAYSAAQDEADFLIVANNAGIADWDDERARAYALAHARKLTVTVQEWMPPYTMLAMTKIAEEQGEWAAQVALEILEGKSPSDIPIVPNRRWDVYVNMKLLEKAGIELSPSILRSAIKVD
jgi:ABC-type uncharacterized transport system substrate-binding protein